MWITLQVNSFVTEVKEVSVLMDEINRIVPAELVTNEYFPYEWCRYQRAVNC